MGERKLSNLTAGQVSDFNRLGYLFPLPALSQAQAFACRQKLEQLENQAGADAQRLRTDLHLLCRWAQDIVMHPAIVTPVTDLLGTDVLCWSMNWFIKEPGDGKFVGYHQDSAYWGLEPNDVVTAWVALSPAPPACGPMRFLPGSHHFEVLEHDDTFAKENLLSRGQEIRHDVKEQDTILAPLESGQFSLHHVGLIHGSGPNYTDDRRIGMAIRYMSTAVRQTKLRDTAMLVHGADHFGHFDLLPGPLTDMGDAERARHSDSVDRLLRAIHSKDYAN